jgi:hypothetical protein
MAWNALPTFAHADVPTAAQLQKFDDNLNFLHTPVVSEYQEATDSSDYTTTSAAGTFVAINSTNFAKTVTMAGGYLLVLFSCVCTRAAFDLLVDGAQQGDATFGSAYWGSTTVLMTVNLPFFFPSLSVGSHTIEMKWCIVTSGTATIYTKYRPRFEVIPLKGG